MTQILLISRTNLSKVINFTLLYENIQNGYISLCLVILKYDYVCIIPRTENPSRCQKEYYIGT